MTSLTVNNTPKKGKVKTMKTIDFITAVGTECRGVLWTWEGLSFALTRDSTPDNRWDVIELATGCSLVGKTLLTRKRAAEMALDVLNSKGNKVVTKTIRKVLLNRVNTPVKGKLRATHCVTPGNQVKTVYGRVRDSYCVPPELLKKAKKPCRRCLKLLQASG
jgi:hypothetical protein